MSRYFQDRTLGQNKKLRTRSVLFDSALVMFSQDGISSTRLDDITQCAGMANATFYNHFKDKGELIRDLSIAIILELMEPFDTAVTEIKDAPVRIVVLLHVAIDTISVHKSWGAFLGQSFYLMPMKTLSTASERFKVEIDLGIEQGFFPTAPDRFQMDQVSAVLLSGLRRLGKDDVNIADRTSENILGLLRMKPADAHLVVGKAHAFL